MLILRIPRQRELPDALGDLPALEDLTLEVGPSFQLGAALRTLSRLPALRTLALNGGEVATLPDEIGLMTRIVRLDLWGTGTERVSAALYGLSQLRELMMHQVRLTELPPALGQLRALTALAVMNSPLARLPEELGELSELIWLYLDGSALAALPSSVARLTRLEAVHLTDCPLRQLPPMPPVRTLRLRAGQLDVAHLTAVLDPRTQLCWEPLPSG